MRTLPIILIVLIIGLFSCYDLDRRIEARQKSIDGLKPKFKPGRTIPASGVDTMTIEIAFPAIDLDSTMVKFTTSEGLFLENNKAEYATVESYSTHPDSARVFRARLKSTTNIGDYLITTDIPKHGVKFVSPISFTQSYATSISTDKNKFAVEASLSDELQLTATLKAGKGYPHKGTEVEFVVADSLSSTSSRWFRALTKTNAEGQASVYFSPGSITSYRGPVKYRAIAKGNGNQSVIATGTFDMIEPTK